ncbi:ATP-binding protein [uncultured Chloroflexus sp.]|uniref:ATP-binding protein n=1 Tax=uncultured Chloroflexus sp. TaxID=214040 RepID=UPI002614EBD3|nr:ATP-binding protein [uncultured Chloroflexus sp.]
MTGAFPLSDETIKALAPCDLPFLRHDPFVRSVSSISITALPENVQPVVRRLYDTLLAIFSRFDQMRRVKLDELRQFLHETGWHDLMHELRGISLSRHDPVLGQVIHDIRGGSLQALALQLQLIEFEQAQPVDVERIYLLVRDHLKIMRNCVPDLDPVRTARDIELRTHGVDLLLEKWQQADYRLPDGTAQIVVDARYNGVVADRCVEFSALDRVIYNLINNATRHSADHRVMVGIYPLFDCSSPSLRFVVANRIDPLQRSALDQRFGQQWSNLFRGGFTFSSDGSKGHGFGLAICAELVANAYGLPNGLAAIAGNYVGAIPHGDLFVAWFHWPIAAP